MPKHAMSRPPKKPAPKKKVAPKKNPPVKKHNGRTKYA